ncbi:hypothetical protein CBF23_012145 [Marinomonas agarivorans]|nr:hypothetical protein CBF23_012145 [Marinomonas agarivorans]
MNKCLLSTVMVSVFFSHILYADDMVGRAVGRAYDKKTGELVYIEEHIKPSATEHQVRYSDPENTVFAVKNLEYARSRVSPNFRQQNELNGELIDVQIKNQTLKITYKEDTESKAESKTIDLTDKRLVIDAGFDEFVRENWDALSNGERQQVDFLVPSQLALIPFEMQKVACIRNIENSLCLSIETKAWWLKLLVSSVHLAYNQDTKYLTRFIGRGNISDADGDYQIVDIHYEYFPSQ